MTDVEEKGSLPSFEHDGHLSNEKGWELAGKQQL